MNLKRKNIYILTKSFFSFKLEQKDENIKKLTDDKEELKKSQRKLQENIKEAASTFNIN